MVAGVVGGVSWMARLGLDLAGIGSDGLLAALQWGGLVLLGVAMFGLGLGLVSRSAAWLQAIVGIALPLLVWSVVEVLHDAGDPVVIDGFVGLVVAALCGAALGRRSEERQPRPRRTHGAHAR
jgi:hypothetical protein